MSTPTHAFQKWAGAYKKAAAKGTELMWPSETLIRVFKGDYVPGLKKKYVGKKVLDVGFGNGNNLIFLGSLGLRLHGTEVTAGICENVQKRLETIGYAADLRVGVNSKIPFADNTFDFLTSWNVLHYENSEKGIRSALQEYRRVLKKGGRFFISTTGPDHKILLNSKSKGMHRYQIGREDDFRKGQVFFYFDAPSYIRYYFEDYFRKVMIGRTHDCLMTETLDWWIISGIK